MGKTTSPTTAGQISAQDELVGRFARLMWDGYRARVYLFGSRARRMALEASDYDLVAVSPAFSGVSRFRRCLDRYELWHAAGGFRQSLDLHCYAPSEFRSELQGLGYLASARARGELVYVSHARSRRQAI